MEKDFVGIGVDLPQLIKLPRFEDGRGYFNERAVFDRLFTPIVQMNHSMSKKNVLRGMHMQPRMAKYVMCVSGHIQDIIVDARPHSRGFGTYYVFYLKAEFNECLFVPPGCLHGFYTIEESNVVYLTSEKYDPLTETGSKWDDQELALPWAFLPEGLEERCEALSKRLYDPPLVSPRDDQLASFLSLKCQLERRVDRASNRDT